VHFPIHVEAGPRVTEWPVQELTKAHVETIDLELGLYRSQQSLKSLSAEEKARLSEARRLERTVNPSSVLLAEGIEPILQSGQFEVTGTVYFRPLKPFDPNPSVPEESEITAEEPIDFVYRQEDSALFLSKAEASTIWTSDPRLRGGVSGAGSKNH